ncbi:AfsR/SARP family transcriptional regulator [Streptomyces sp. A3M-1-3]|uniref:AfsR/SARP family transcriptional regulator n=1 Tax=Streptomyces sp. A3M-1-3 TaxID=2962044 RepID=UPI0020B74BCC|nr:AfsR/SARP family transcriptional regulator [Streptomyces sp. A3M-1-3]MCP3822822.1 AfsR/SARP family transcriptional regulator [Streptomyces sp. A3M-1-3]
MDIDVLGGLQVLENGVPLAPATPETLQVLAMLAAHPDQVVPVSMLAEELLTHAPAEYTRSVLHSCVRQLRELLAAALGRAAGSDRTPETVLVALPGGYLLDSGGGRIDLHEFMRDTGAGYRSMALGDFENAARRLRSALGLWRGPAFDGVIAGKRLAERIAALEEARLSILDQWVEAELALGRQRELLSELAALTAQHRTQENPHGHYTAALQRSGRRAEAVGAHRTPYRYST